MKHKTLGGDVIFIQEKSVEIYGFTIEDADRSGIRIDYTSDNNNTTNSALDY